MTTTTEDTDDLISEHERLVRVLRSPSHQDDRREAKVQAKELASMKRQKRWPIQKQAPVDRPAVELGDELYFQHPQTGPRSGKVIAHGAHGVTLQCAAGQRHQVRWDRVLGAKQRMAQDFDLVDQGEDGAVLANAQGQRRFMKWPAADEVQKDEVQAERNQPLRKARPSPAQIEAGNYKKHHRSFQGLRISIENPKGSVRQGVDPDGKPWRVKMTHPYGYIRGSQGVDKDHVDCFIGPNQDATHAYVIHQRKAGQWDQFDEDKVMLGFDSSNAAKAAYLAHHDDPRFFGDMVKMPMAEFKQKVLATARKPRMIKSIVLFFKAQQSSFFMPVQIHGHTRADGTFVAPYIGNRKKRPNAGSKTQSLFPVEHPKLPAGPAASHPVQIQTERQNDHAVITQADLKKFTARASRSSGVSGGIAFGATTQNADQALGFGLRQAVERGKDQYIIPTLLGFRGTGNTQPPMIVGGQSIYLATRTGELWQGTWGFSSPDDPDWKPGAATTFRPTRLLMKVSDLPPPVAAPEAPPAESRPELTLQPPVRPAPQAKASGELFTAPLPAKKANRAYRTPAATQLAATLKAGDLKGALAVLAPLALRDAEETLLYTGFPMTRVKTKAALLAHIQPYLLTAAQSRTDGFDMPQLTAKSLDLPADARILFFKAGPIKNRPGLALQTLTDSKGHTTQRWKRTTQKPKADRRPAAADPDPHDQRGSKHGYGTHDLQPGSHVKFKVGDYESQGKVTAVGSAGVTAEDAEGRPHRVHFHEITHHAPSEAAPKQPTNSAVLGKQDPIPAESFNAADYAKSHDQADVTADKIIAQFPPDTESRIKAAQQRLEGIEQTIDQFKQDGKWNAQREVLHHKIIAEILSPERVKAATPAPGEKPTFMILGGRGGSGKSSFNGLVYDPDKFIVLDADHLKGLLPEYEGWNAHQVHEESSKLFDDITDLAQEFGLNVCHDATMKTGKKAVELVKRFKDAGYRTEAHYMHLPRQEAAKRAVARFINGGEKGRYVPVDVVLSNTSNEASFDSVKSLVDKWSFRDNNVPKGGKPILISESGQSAPLKKSMGRAIERAIENHRPLLIRRM